MIMSIRFILLLLLLWTSPSRSSIPTSTINFDVAELTNLNEAFKTNSPAIFHRLQSLVCEMIDMCCSSIKSRLNKYIGTPTNDASALVKECIGNPPRQSVLDDCPTLLKFLTVAKDDDLHKYTNVLMTAGTELQSSDIRMPQMCSSEEAYVLLCDWTKRDKIESCTRKNLVYLAEHRSDADYRAFVQENKQNLRVLINAMSKAFPMENITKTMTWRASVGPERNRLLSSSSTTQTPNGSSTFSQKTQKIIIILLASLFAVCFC